MTDDPANKLTFLKLGGSLLTDKKGVEALRPNVLERLAGEIKDAVETDPALRLLLGHGSGSYGHVAAAKFDTRSGVSTPEEWMGYANVSDAAARLNRHVCSSLLDAGLPVLSLQPSASAECRNGRIVRLATAPIIFALDAGIVPVVYGDVAFDAVRGGTIISTEEIMGYLATKLVPARLLLAGETDGVLDAQGKSIPEFSEGSMAALSATLGASRGTDVTGGMASKVQGMLELVQRIDGLTVRVFSGLQPGNVHDVLVGQAGRTGTLIT